MIWHFSYHMSYQPEMPILAQGPNVRRLIWVEGWYGMWYEKCHIIIIDEYMAFFILHLLSARDLDIGPEGFNPRNDISRGLMTRAIWKRPCINLFITYFARADNIYCPRKMLLPRRQITRHKLCFYYTCKFGFISIKYVIIYN